MKKLTIYQRGWYDKAPELLIDSTGAILDRRIFPSMIDPIPYSDTERMLLMRDHDYSIGPCMWADFDVRFKASDIPLDGGIPLIPKGDTFLIVSYNRQWIDRAIAVIKQFDIQPVYGWQNKVFRYIDKGEIKFDFKHLRVSGHSIGLDQFSRCKSNYFDALFQ